MGWGSAAGAEGRVFAVGIFEASKSSDHTCFTVSRVLQKSCKLWMVGATPRLLKTELSQEHHCLSPCLCQGNWLQVSDNDFFETEYLNNFHLVSEPEIPGSQQQLSSVQEPQKEGLTAREEYLS
ncbi:uncharacterized protein RG961_002603 isoform 1-T2 [Leptosomus discolor]